MINKDTIERLLQLTGFWKPSPISAYMLTYTDGSCTIELYDYSCKIYVKDEHDMIRSKDEFEYEELVSVEVGNSWCANDNFVAVRFQREFRDKDDWKIMRWHTIYSDRKEKLVPFYQSVGRSE